MKNYKIFTEKFWGWMGKITALLILIWTAIQIYNSLQPKSDYKLSANGEYYDFKVPQLLYGFIDASQKQELYNINDTILPNYYTDRRIRNPLLEKLVNGNTATLLSYYIKNLSKQKTCFNLTVKNTGGKAIDKISLEFPYSGFYFLTKKGEAATSAKCEGGILIGSLSPSSEANIIIWTDGTPPDDFINRDSRGKFTFNDGYAIIEYAKNVNGFYKSVINNFWIIIFIMIVLFVIIIYLLLRVNKYKNLLKIEAQKSTKITKEVEIPFDTN